MSPHGRVARTITGRHDPDRWKFLATFGVIYLFIGWSFVVSEPTAPARAALSWLPVPFWILGAGWMLAGFVAVLAAFGPTIKDKRGFVALMVPASVWSGAYAVTVVLQLFGLHQAPRAYVSVFIFGALALAVDLVSGMVSASQVRR